MKPLGLTVDIPVTTTADPERFYTMLLGRGPDLRTDGVLIEWILTRDPELALRLCYRDQVREPVRVGIAVADLGVERVRLAEHFADIPAIELKPKVIATRPMVDRARRLRWRPRHALLAPLPSMSGL